MGRFRFEFQGVGNHGCGRFAGDGEIVPRCGQSNCADCICADLVEAMIASGANVEVAELRHWPDSDPPGPVDDLKTGTRKGSF